MSDFSPWLIPFQSPILNKQGSLLYPLLHPGPMTIPTTLRIILSNLI